MTRTAHFSCRCGGVTGLLHDAAPAQVCHLVCYCRDCRAFARYMDRMGALEPGGGSSLVQVLPARIEMSSGAQHIGCLRLSPKGLHRWYATCCGSPLANTVGSSRMPLAGMWRPLFADPSIFGPVRVHGFVKSALSGQGAPAKDKGLAFMLGGLIKRGLGAYMAGTARHSPFFDAAGAPVSVPHVLTGDERRAAYAD